MFNWILFQTRKPNFTFFATVCCLICSWYFINFLVSTCELTCIQDVMLVVAVGMNGSLRLEYWNSTMLVDRNRRSYRMLTCRFSQLLLYYYYIRLTVLFSRMTWVSQHQKGKTSLDLNETREDGVLGCSWTICKQPAPGSRQISMPTHHHSIFAGRMLFLMPSQQHQSTECSHKLDEI